MVLDFSLIPTAYAAGANMSQNPQAGSPLPSMLLLGGFVVLFYFMLWRPQNKRNKEHQSLLANLKKGDEVVTNGGILGRISKLADDFVVVTISEGTEIKIQKLAISSIMPKGTIKSV